MTEMRRNTAQFSAQRFAGGSIRPQPHSSEPLSPHKTHSLRQALKFINHANAPMADSNVSELLSAWSLSFAALHIKTIDMGCTRLPLLSKSHDLAVCCFLHDNALVSFDSHIAALQSAT